MEGAAGTRGLELGQQEAGARGGARPGGRTLCTPVLPSASLHPLASRGTAHLPLCPRLRSLGFHLLCPRLIWSLTFSLSVPLSSSLPLYDSHLYPPARSCPWSSLCFFVSVSSGLSSLSQCLFLCPSLSLQDKEPCCPGDSPALTAPPPGGLMSAEEDWRPAWWGPWSCRAPDPARALPCHLAHLLVARLGLDGSWSLGNPGGL